MKIPRVLIVVPSAQRRGGGDIWISELVKAIPATKITLHIVFEKSGELVKTVQSAGHQAHVLWHQPSGPRNFINMAILLSKVIRFESPDVIIHWTPRAHIYATLAQKIACKHIPTAWVQHVIPSKFWLHWLASVLPADLTACVSTPVAAKQKLLYPNTRPVVLHPGINHERNELSQKTLPHRLELDKNQCVVGLLGRVEPWKGQDILISALSILRSQGLPIHVLLVGSENSPTWPDFAPQVRELIHRKEVENYVTFTGHLDNIQEVLPALNMLVCASREEGFGLSIIDAMAAGIPVIATRCGGPEDIIEHERNGILVNPENPNALAAAIQRIHEDSELASKIISEARITYQQRFTAAHSAASFLSLIDNITSS